MTGEEANLNGTFDDFHLNLLFSEDQEGLSHELLDFTFGH